MYTEIKIIRKSFVNFIKKRNEVINKRGAEVIKWKFKSLLKLNDKKFPKVRDHCYYTGKYRDAAHSICNLSCSVPKNIPLAFHNWSNYG